jgi:hypothetical protein
MTKDEIISDIHKYVATYGESPGEREFANATGIKPWKWKGKLWVRWSEAVREAGYAPKSMIQRTPDADMLQKLANLVLRLGRFPVRDEINFEARATPGFFAYQAFHKRFGGMREAAEALLKFSRENGNAELAAICEARLAKEAAVALPVKGGRKSRQATRVGVVYLKYSRKLRLYKIGKANDGDKRGAGISLLLPEDLVPKHEIKTDFPFILEKYWHSRFRAKRKQGEWFDLSKEDVESFKKRREFMFCEFFP